MKYKQIFPVLSSLVCLVLLAGCLSRPALVPEAQPTPPPYEEPEIPADFTTYTEEGLFSISYPSDWQPATSIMGEIFEETMREMGSEIPGALFEGISVLFMAGKETPEGYYPGVSILTERRATGFWTVDEAYEVYKAVDIELTQGFRELSVLKTKVDGRDAIICHDEDDEPGYGRWQHLTMITAKGDFIWLVGCSCEYQDFDGNEKTFNSIVRSLKILN